MIFNTIGAFSLTVASLTGAALAAPAIDLKARSGSGCKVVAHDFTNSQAQPGYDVKGRLQLGPTGFQLYSSNPTEYSRVKYQDVTFNTDSLTRTIISIKARAAPDPGKTTVLYLGNPRCVEGPPNDCDQLNLLTYHPRDDVKFQGRSLENYEYWIQGQFAHDGLYDAFNTVDIKVPDPSVHFYTYTISIVKGQSMQFTMTDGSTVIGQSPVYTDKVPNDPLNLYVSMDGCHADMPVCSTTVNFMEVASITYTYCP